MPKNPNQKHKLLKLQQILLEHTDEEHVMTVPQLIVALEQHEIRAERKSIYDDMEALRSLGVDVQCRKGHAPGWFVGVRTFQLAELKLLVDAVQSSKFITRRKSDDLIRKLASLASIHQARQLQRQVYVSGRIKSMNESVYYNIDKLHAAIADKTMVTFRYFEYNVQKKKVFRRDGERYTVSPYGLIWDNQNYYLVAFHQISGQMRHYRVDKMSDLQVTDLPRTRNDACKNFNITTYSQKHFSMFSGREAEVTLRCQNTLVGVVLDRFGQDTMLIPDGSTHFIITVPAVVSPQFLGWLFGLGAGVSLRSPDWAVDTFRDQLATVGKGYRR